MALAQLDDRLAANNTLVLLVGDARYREPAKRLMKKLDLPFRYVADNGALRRYYHVYSGDRGTFEGALVFVDTHGIIRFSRCGCLGHVMRDFKQFLSLVEMVDVAQSEHIMGSSQNHNCRSSSKHLPQ